MAFQKHILWIFLSLVPIAGQGKSLIYDSITLGKIRAGLDRIYNFEFEAANETLNALEKQYPGHPVTSLFEGLILYWKHYPLIPGAEGSTEFKRAMEESWKRAGKLAETPAKKIESVFFDLISRSFLVMYFADNGIPGRAIGHLWAIYRDVMKGFDMQDEFKEFMFTSGLYNYYREAYVEAYPVYKPASIFFRHGDMDKGLKMLRKAIDECNFLHVEAAFFLTLIYINFESLPDSAARYAGMLHNHYPRNSCFHAKYAEMLLVNLRYEEALPHIIQISELDPYNRMKAMIYLGIYHEKQNGDLEKARDCYEKGLKLADPFGSRADYTKAYAFMGLSRYYSRKGNREKKREFRRKAEHSTGYEYILNDY